MLVARNVQLLSSAHSDDNRDYLAETSDADRYAMATVFARRDGAVRHAWSSELWFVPPEPGRASGTGSLKRPPPA